MTPHLTIGISACLFGNNTRYDGGNRREPLLLKALAPFAALVPLCPEFDCGLGVPREPMRLEGEPENPRLLTITSRRDLTDRLHSWSARRLTTFAEDRISGLILKSRSPSCGRQVAVHGNGETPVACAYSPGLFARMVMERFPTLPIADEEELRDPARLSDFLKRITADAQNPQEKQR